MARPNSSNWIPLRRACEILGINQSTLRHWADSGRVRTFRTPGGHRRFYTQDIEGLADASPMRGPVVNDTALVSMRRRLTRRKAGAPEIAGNFDDAARTRLRVFGRRLVSMASDWLSNSRPRPEISEEARYLGAEYGRELAAGGVGPRDAISAFIFFRNSLMDSLISSSPVGARPDISALEDEILLQIAGAYEAKPSSVNKKRTSG